MALAILVATFLTVALGREFMLVKLSGWQRLSRKYRCRAPFPGKCRACWWAQFIKPRPKREIVVNVGRLTRWPFRLEFPPYWIGADSGGLYVKRNVRNLLHPALLIPWESIENAVELTYKDLVWKTATASDVARRPKELLPAMAAAQGIDEPLLELKISDPDVFMVAQLAAFEQALPFLQTKLALSNNKRVSSRRFVD